MVNLAEDAIIEILMCLPLNSAVRFRCVCKSWYKLLDPKFINTKLKKLNLLVTRKEPVYQEYSVELKSLISNNEPAVEYMYPFEKPYGDGSIQILGSCQGLICAHHAGTVFYVWNPYTAEYIEIPGVIGNARSLENIVYGFGYDSNTCNYKFVTIDCEPDMDFSEVRMYNLGRSSWKTYDSCIPYEFSRGEPAGVFLNGALHWLASMRDGYDDSQPRVLISMDMEDGVFKEIEQPAEDMEDFDYRFVGVFSGCLCLLCSVSNAKFEIWEMKEYGVSESWSKVFRTDQQQLMTMGIRSWPYIRRAVLLRNGEVLLEISRRAGPYEHAAVDVVKIHLEEKFRCQNRGRNAYMKNILQMETYVESLVSVNSGTFVGDEQKGYLRNRRV